MLAVPFLAFADDTFVPLTNLPGISSVSASLSLPSFINNLYRIAIGVAAFFAVVEIGWAGYLFMTSADSISKNTKARQKITNAIIGLVLVLSPYVVFSIINPKILDISLNFAGLQSKNGTGGDVNPGSSASNPVISVDSTSSRSAADAACTGQGGTSYFQCKPPAGNPYTVTKDQACKTGETNITTCTKPANTDPNVCTTTGIPTVAAPNGDTEYAAEGYVQVKASCCSGMTSGNTCWQKPK